MYQPRVKYVNILQFDKQNDAVLKASADALNAICLAGAGAMLAERRAQATGADSDEGGRG